jgi:hypothetical protein
MVPSSLMPWSACCLRQGRVWGCKGRGSRGHAAMEAGSGAYSRGDGQMALTVFASSWGRASP